MAQSITVRVKLASRDEAFEVAAQRSQTVQQLKQQIAAAASIPADKQRLIFQGRLLKDTDTLEAVGVQDGHTLHVAATGVSAAAAPSTSPSSATSPSGSTSPPAPTATPAPTPTFGPNPALVAAFDDAMRTLLDNPEAAAREAVTVLHKIVSNIHDHPLEEKYRKLKKSNATFSRKLGGLPGGIPALRALGFVENGDDLVLHPSPELWPVVVSAKRKLDGFIARLNSTTPGSAIAAAPRAAAAAPSPAPAAGASTAPMMDPLVLQQFLQGLQQLHAQQQQQQQQDQQPSGDGAPSEHSSSNDQA